MIKLQEFTPEIYYDQSRDFQLLGRMFDLVLNSAKTEAELVATIPFSDNSPDNLLELLSLTFGLRLEPGKYTDQQLRAVCSVALKMMRAKGSLTAIALLCTALLRANNIAGEYLIDVSKQGFIEIYIPPEAAERELILDILPYIAPAGLIYKVYYAIFRKYNQRMTFSPCSTVVFTHLQEQETPHELVRLDPPSENPTLTLVETPALTPVEIIRQGRAFEIKPTGQSTVYLGFTANTTLYPAPKSTTSPLENEGD